MPAAIAEERRTKSPSSISTAITILKKGVYFQPRFSKYKPTNKSESVLSCRRRPHTYAFRFLVFVLPPPRILCSTLDRSEYGQEGLRRAQRRRGRRAPPPPFPRLLQWPAPARRAGGAAGAARALDRRIAPAGPRHPAPRRPAKEPLPLLLPRPPSARRLRRPHRGASRSRDQEPSAVSRVSPGR
jgi:hypothetical protein